MARQKIINPIIAGHLLITPDATYDIGASGATRPRDIYTSRDVKASGVVYAGKRVIGYCQSNATTLNMVDYPADIYVFGENAGGTGTWILPPVSGNDGWMLTVKNAQSPWHGTGEFSVYVTTYEGTALIYFGAYYSQVLSFRLWWGTSMGLICSGGYWHLLPRYEVTEGT